MELTFTMNDFVEGRQARKVPFWFYLFIMINSIAVDRMSFTSTNFRSVLRFLFI